MFIYQIHHGTVLKVCFFSANKPVISNIVHMKLEYILLVWFFAGKTDLLVMAKKKIKKKQNIEHTTNHLSLRVNKRKN